MDKDRKVFPCTESLEDLLVQTKSKWESILDERKEIGESLKKIEDHLNLVTRQLREYMKTNEERAKCIVGFKAEVLPVLSIDTIHQYEENYLWFLEESAKELDALKNITHQAKSIDDWRAQVDHYQQELHRARERKQEFGEDSPSLFKLLLELVAPVVSLSEKKFFSLPETCQVLSNNSQQDSFSGHLDFPASL